MCLKSYKKKKKESLGKSIVVFNGMVRKVEGERGRVTVREIQQNLGTECATQLRCRGSLHVHSTWNW